MSKPSDFAFSYEGVLIAANKDRHGYIVKVAIHPNDVPENFVKDPVGTRYQFAVVKLKDNGLPDGKPQKKADGGEVKHAALLCINPQFQKFMVDKHMAFDESEGGARDAVIRYCRITSRAELKTDERARRRFHELVAEYEALVD